MQASELIRDPRHLRVPGHDAMRRVAKSIDEDGVFIAFEQLLIAISSAASSGDLRPVQEVIDLLNVRTLIADDPSFEIVVEDDQSWDYDKRPAIPAKDLIERLRSLKPR